MKTLVDSSSPYKDIYASERIRIGFWYRKFKIKNSTTLQIGRICFWFTIKHWIKKFKFRRRVMG